MTVGQSSYAVLETESGLFSEYFDGAGSCNIGRGGGQIK